MLREYITSDAFRGVFYDAKYTWYKSLNLAFIEPYYIYYIILTKPCPFAALLHHFGSLLVNRFFVCEVMFCSSYGSAHDCRAND